ncbi:hypothetical protein LCGC14_1844310 [marine sediment metagenome]|uniref:Uncharacterized protein n=1 Tax=marine sediment metagenome TaxID=412755 RepID=A0A0F9IRU9_9ZZZZ
MPVRVRANPPGEFIRDHLVAAGGMDYPQSIHRAYKAYLRDRGLDGASRASMSKYIWLANQLGLVAFDHAEPSEYWNAVEDGVEVPPEYVRESRPHAPSPRHYYRILDPGDPRWIRLEASYRESIGLEVRPMAPRPPVRPPAPPPAKPPPKVKRPKVEKPPKVPKKPPAKPPRPTPAERVAPYEERVGVIIATLEELETSPSLEAVEDIENRLLDLGEDVVGAMAKARGTERTLLGNINSRLRSALEEMGLLRSSVERVLAAAEPAQRIRAEAALRAAIRVFRENLATGE